MATNINVNSTAQIFNNVLMSVDGDTDFPLNGYISGVTFTTGSQADWIKTFTSDGNPKDTNLIVSSPTSTITFAPMMIESFYTFLNNKYSKFTLQFIQYTTGNMNGPRKTLLIENARINENSGTMRPSSPAHEFSLSIVATKIEWI